jgi:hypothetical protein
VLRDIDNSPNNKTKEPACDSTRSPVR